MHLLAILLAIATVESGNNSNLVGKDGELGKYQIGVAAWSDVRREPFTHEWVLHKQDATAEALIRRMVRRFPAHLREHPEWIAAAWNCGVSRCEKAKWQFSRLPKSTQAYVRKFTRQYNRLVRFEVASSRSSPAAHR